MVGRLGGHLEARVLDRRAMRRWPTIIDLTPDRIETRIDGPKEVENAALIAYHRVSPQKQVVMLT